MQDQVNSKILQELQRNQALTYGSEDPDNSQHSGSLD